MLETSGAMGTLVRVSGRHTTFRFLQPTGYLYNYCPLPVFRLKIILHHSPSFSKVVYVNGRVINGQWPSFQLVNGRVVNGQCQW